MSTVRALYDCDGSQEAGELTFRKGDVIEQAAETEEPGWYFGILQKSGESGLFPFNYVEMVPDKPEPSKPSRNYIESRPLPNVGNMHSESTNGSAGAGGFTGNQCLRTRQASDINRKSVTGGNGLANGGDQGNTETEPSSMSVKALRARLENTKSTPPVARQPVQQQPSMRPPVQHSVQSPVQKPIQQSVQLPAQQPIPQKLQHPTGSASPRTAPVPSPPASQDNEEDVAFLKPSELRKKWAAVDAATKQTPPTTTARRSFTTNTSSRLPQDSVKPHIAPKDVPEPLQPPVIKPAASPVPPKRSPPSLSQHPSPSPSERSNTISRTSARTSTAIERSESPIARRPVSANQELLPPPRTLPRRPQVQSQIYPSSNQTAPPLPSRPQSAAESSQQTPTPPPRPMPARRQSQAFGNRPTSHMPPPATAVIHKTIPIGDRIKYDTLFDENSDQGYVSRDTAFRMWQESRIGETNLRDISELVDIRGDGWLDRKQFAAGMFLIDDRLRGFCIPNALPIGIM